MGLTNVRTGSSSGVIRSAMPYQSACDSLADTSPVSMTRRVATACLQLSQQGSGLQARRNRERIGVMARKLIIVLVYTDPRNGEELGVPFFHAVVAAAMNFDVHVICAATAGRLMKKGVAEKLTVKPGADKTVYDFIRDAHGHGAKFYACPANLELFDMTEADLIPECTGLMGWVAMIAQIMEDVCRVLTY